MRIGASSYAGRDTHNDSRHASDRRAGGLPRSEMFRHEMLTSTQYIETQLF
jgi:hypothetical protein